MTDNPKFALAKNGSFGETLCEISSDGVISLNPDLVKQISVILAEGVRDELKTPNSANQGGYEEGFQEGLRSALSGIGEFYAIYSEYTSEYIVLKELENLLLSDRNVKDYP